METNGLWKKAFLTSRKQFENASVNSPLLECNVYFATGDGRKRFDCWQYKQLSDPYREDAAGQSLCVTSDLVVSALFFGKSEEGNLFKSLAEEAGGIIRDTPTEILKRFNIDYPQDMYWSTRWAATIAEIAVTLRFSKSRRKTWHDSLPMSIDWNPSRGGFYFIEVKNVFSASVRAIDVLTSAEETEPDLSAFVPATDLWPARTEFKQASDCTRFIKEHPEIRFHKPSKNRMQIHAGDWHRFWNDHDKKQAELLLDESLEEAIADKTAREAEEHLRKNRKKQSR